ncbi:MAG TPA: phosphoribosyltransferase family protein, partial [Actinomycetota bacterium]|nr:phosphoribosyltransferase family protein [Actinomycetota bacterium]
MDTEKVVLDGDDIRRTLVRIAHEIVEKNAEPDALAIVGIHRRGALLAQRVHRLVEDLLDRDVPLGDLDISFYRDDLAHRPEQPVVHASHVDFPLD